MKEKNQKFFVDKLHAEELTLDVKHSDETSEILYEDKSKRSENAKHFRMKNGNYRAVMYDRPVHRKDPETGEFLDILPVFEENEQSLEATLAHYGVKFPRKDGARKYVTVNKNGREFGWRYVSPKVPHRKRAEAMMTSEQEYDRQKPSSLPEVRYEKVDNYVTLSYRVMDGEVKESMILSKSPLTSSFRFDLKTVGIVPRLSEDGKQVLLFAEEGAMDENAVPEMVIPPANMTDANGVYTEELHYVLHEENGITWLELVAEGDWLSDPERAYPVVVDPRVRVYGMGNRGLSMVEMGSDTAVNATEKKVGVDSNGSHTLYLNFDYPTLARNYKIVSASVKLWQLNCVKETDNELYDVEYLPSDDTYAETFSEEIQNNDVGFHYGAEWTPLTTFRAIEKTGDDCFVELDITDIVTDHYNSSHDGFTQSLKIKNGFQSGEHSITFSSFNHEEHPSKIYIEYISKDAYVDSQATHTISNGRAGTGSISLHTGDLVWAHEDMVLEDSNPPLTISHVYRPTDEYSAPYGKNWRLSLDQRIIVENDKYVPIIYIDGAGRQHYFSCTRKNVFKDQGGLGLTLRLFEGCSGVTELEYQLEDSSNQKLWFDETGKLVKMITPHQDEITFVYENDRLCWLRHSVSYSEQTNILFLDYNEDTGRLWRIHGRNGYAVYYDYDTNGDLISITYYPKTLSAADYEAAPKTRFTYDDHKLTSVCDQSGITDTFTYDDSERVSNVARRGRLCVADQIAAYGELVEDDSVSMTYYKHSTMLRNDRTGIKTVYKYDDYGRKTHRYLNLIGTEHQSASTLSEIIQYEPIEDPENDDTPYGKYRNVSAQINQMDGVYTNLIFNGIFADDEGTAVPERWQVTDGYGRVTNTENFPVVKAYYLSPDSSTTECALEQTIPLCVCDSGTMNTAALSGNVIVVSAWAKAEETDSQEERSKCRLVLDAIYEDGTSETFSDAYDEQCTDWQYAAVVCPIPKDQVIQELRVKLEVFGSGLHGYYFSNVKAQVTDGLVVIREYKKYGDFYREVFDEKRNIHLIEKKWDGVLKTVNYIDFGQNVAIQRLERLDYSIYENYYKYHWLNDQIEKERNYRANITEYGYNDENELAMTCQYYESVPNVYRYRTMEYHPTKKHLVTEESDPRYKYGNTTLSTQYEYDTGAMLHTSTISPSGQRTDYAYDNQTYELTKISSTTDGDTLQNTMSYTYGYPTRVSHNGTNFVFDYDLLGRESAVKVGTTKLAEMEYLTDEVTKCKSVRTTYPTGERMTVEHDIFGNPVRKTVEKNGISTELVTAEYDLAGNVTKLIDKVAKICYTYIYNRDGQVTAIVERDSETNEILRRTLFTYDEEKLLTKKTYIDLNQTYTPIYEGYPDHPMIGIRLKDRFEERVENERVEVDGFERNGLTRVGKKTLKLLPSNQELFRNEYTYWSVEQGTITADLVTMVKEYINGSVGATWFYDYDRAGNISSTRRNGSTVANYYYDGLNRLVREDNIAANKTYVWEYDVGGNITSKRTYALADETEIGDPEQECQCYAYSTGAWRDQLTCYNGYPIIYDAMGNPTTYRGKALEWSRGRRLTKYGNVTFEYDEAGIRTKKNDTTYVLDGTRILRETTGTQTISYYYGMDGVIGFRYGNSDYYYRKNLLGDVIGIYCNGVCVAQYNYDAWGKVLSVNNLTADNIGTLNPFRYRGYYYDVETGLYYLETRYYDPEVGRFLNSDSVEYLDPETLGGLNLYAYCNNNPVMYIDKTGKSGIAAIILGIVLVGVAIGCTSSQSRKRNPAEEKYNEDTINFSVDEIGTDPDKLNVTFYPDAGLIHIENSYSIQSEAEKRAVISAIMESEYYSSSLYGNSVDTMLMEWSGHNFVYHAASKSKWAYAFFQQFGYKTPIESTQGVDFRRNLPRSSERNYKMITLWGSLQW